MRMSMAEIVERAVGAERAGFSGIAMMDHLAPPAAEQVPMFEAMATATWIAAHTSRLSVGHLVLCDMFRDPAVLAKQAVTLNHASGGRFELGIGWGSAPRPHLSACGHAPSRAIPFPERSRVLAPVFRRVGGPGPKAGPARTAGGRAKQPVVQPPMRSRVLDAVATSRSFESRTSASANVILDPGLVTHPWASSTSPARTLRR